MENNETCVEQIRLIQIDALDLLLLGPKALLLSFANAATIMKPCRRRRRIRRRRWRRWQWRKRNLVERALQSQCSNTHNNFIALSTLRWIKLWLALSVHSRCKTSIQVTNEWRFIIQVVNHVPKSALTVQLLTLVRRATVGGVIFMPFIYAWHGLCRCCCVWRRTDLA